MTDEQLKLKFHRVLGEIVERSDTADLDPKQTLAAIGADDLDAVEFLMALEEAFEIELPDIPHPPCEGLPPTAEMPPLDETSTIAHCLGLVRAKVANNPVCNQAGEKDSE